MTRLGGHRQNTNGFGLVKFVTLYISFYPPNKTKKVFIFYEQLMIASIVDYYLDKFNLK